MTSRASFFSRLALALLAIAGVVVPTQATAVRDEVVIESSLERPSAHVAVTPEVARVCLTTTAMGAPRELVEREPVTRRRFLLNRAWLV